MKLDRLPGFRDFYPDPLPHHDLGRMSERSHIFHTWRQIAHRYAFQEYDGPPLEQLDLYKAKSGDEIVHQLYHFVDKGDRAIALRPEMTPTLARMVAAHERSYRKPMKWFSIPQLFRYERQQKGRLREHFQLNADIIGEPQPQVDSELIALLIDSLKAFGLTHDDFVIRLSSREAWQQFFSERDTKSEDAYAFFQVIDKLERTPQEQSASKLEALGISIEEVTEFIEAGKPTEWLEQVLHQLDLRGMGDYVKIDYGIIRGLAYYSGVVFEAFDKKGEFRAIAGGGRYDHLVGLISKGKTELSAIGFGMGDVVLADMLRAKGLFPSKNTNSPVFLLIENDSLKEASLRFLQELRDIGCNVEWSIAGGSGNKQFKHARDLGVQVMVKLLDSTTCEVKDLTNRQVQQFALSEYLSAQKATPQTM